MTSCHCTYNACLWNQFIHAHLWTRTWWEKVTYKYIWTRPQHAHDRVSFKVSQIISFSALTCTVDFIQSLLVYESLWGQFSQGTSFGFHPSVFENWVCFIIHCAQLIFSLSLPASKLKIAQSDQTMGSCTPSFTWQWCMCSSLIRLYIPWIMYIWGGGGKLF